MASDTPLNVPDPVWKQSLLDQVGETLNLCFQCGTCTSSCPSGRLTAFRTRQVIRKAQFGLKDLILPTDDLWTCTTCFTCYERCPRGVEIVSIITALRNMAVRAGYMSESHQKLVRTIYETGHMIPVSEKITALRKQLGLPEKPPTVLVDEEARRQVKFILDQTGLMMIIKGEK